MSLLSAVLSIVAVLILGAGLALAAGMFAWARRTTPALVSAWADGRKGAGAAEERNLALRVTELEIKVERLPMLWEEMSERSERAAERARYHARKSARRRDEELEEFEDDSGVSAPDGNGSDQGAVHPVREGVEDDPADYIRLGWARKMTG